MCNDRTLPTRDACAWSFRTKGEVDAGANNDQVPPRWTLRLAHGACGPAKLDLAPDRLHQVAHGQDECSWEEGPRQRVLRQPREAAEYDQDDRKGYEREGGSQRVGADGLLAPCAEAAPPDPARDVVPG